MKIAAAYIRVSTEDQTEYSPDSQIKKIRDYAKSHDMMVPAEYVFADEGISGKTTQKRPAFNRMIGLAKSKPKPFEAILVWKFSRFARNREDSIIYKSMLRKQLGIDVISISENLGDDKTSIIFEAMIEAMDEYYSINLAEEVKRGMLEKASRGGTVGSAAFGYRVRGGKMEPDPNTAPLVHKIFTDYANGKPMRTLAQELNAMGIRSKRGYPFENRNIDYILHNPVYIGKIRWSINGKSDRNFENPNIRIFDGQHTPIIESDLWEAVQQRLQENKRLYHHKYDRPRTDKPWIFQGLVRCSACGRTIVQAAAGIRVQCIGYAHGTCSVSHSIEIHLLKDAVIHQIEADFSRTELFANLRNQKLAQTQPVPDLCQAQIAKEERKLQRLQEAYAAGIDTLDEYRKAKAQVEADIQAIRESIPAAPPILSLEQLRKDMNAKLLQIKDPNVADSEKNLILRTFVDYIIFSRAHSSIRIIYRI